MTDAIIFPVFTVFKWLDFYWSASVKLASVNVESYSRYFACHVFHQKLSEFPLWNKPLKRRSEIYSLDVKGHTLTLSWALFLFSLICLLKDSLTLGYLRRRNHEKF